MQRASATALGIDARPDRASAMIQTSIRAGLAGGSIMLTLAMVASAAMGDGFWEPVRLVATVAAVPAGDGFSWIALILGGGVHLVLAMAFAAAFVFAAQPLAWHSESAVEAAGAGYGLVLYCCNFVVLSALPPFSAFADLGRGPLWLAVHVLFGIVVAVEVLKARDHYLYPEIGT